MTDIQILLITAAAAVAFWAYRELCDRVRS
jgi:hypothetical protein